MLDVGDIQELQVTSMSFLDGRADAERRCAAIGRTKMHRAEITANVSHPYDIADLLS